MKNLPKQEDQRKRKAESGPAYGKKSKLDPGVGKHTDSTDLLLFIMNENSISMVLLHGNFGLLACARSID
jgi:hypothetical protein